MSPTPDKSLDTLFKDPFPEMDPPLSTLVNLQLGVVDPRTGEWATKAQVRELTGEDEEFLAGLESKGNLTYAEYMTALLKRAVVSIGDIEVQDDPLIIEDLIIGDRDNLFLGIVRCTYGVEREFNVKCPSCEEKNLVTINLEEDFPRQEPGIDLTEPIEVKLRNGKTIKVRLPNGSDTAYVGKHGNSVAAQNTLMISRCLVDTDTGGLTPEKWAAKLNVADRTKIVNAILDVKTGPELKEVNTHCASCGVNMPIALNWVSLLFS